MEFSFDRSRPSNSTQQTAQASHANTQQPSTDEVDTSQIANERLRKAIERNRAKQKERERTAQTNGTAWSQHNVHSNISDPRGGATTAAAEPRSFSQTTRPTEVHEKVEIKEEPVQSTLFESPKEETVAAAATATATRRSVARPNEAEFAPIKRTPKRAAAHISYTTGHKRKEKSLDPKIVNFIVKGSWAFCGFLVLRLLFANGGIQSYFSQKSILNERFTEISKIKSENLSLVKEIERMQLDASYQKKLVRDNLGFIAEDEFLILFPKD